ncbi:DUF1491 family protein [Sphingomonas sp. MMS24-JH45]
MRLPTHLTVGALLRRANDGGGFGVVRASGEAESGALLVLLDEGGRMRAVERMRDLDDRDVLVATETADATNSAMDDYWRGRRARDPDLWVVELSVAAANGSSLKRSALIDG